MESIEMWWHFQTELLKSAGMIRNVLAFAEGAVKKVLASLEMCRHLLKELLNKFLQA